VPNSSGSAAPRAAAPAGACDCHFHLLDPRFPSPDAAKPAGMAFDDYRLLQRRIGTRRAVLVQAKYHRTDPACILDALARFGGDARAVAVLHPDVPDAELGRLDAAGVRGCASASGTRPTRSRRST